MQQVASALHDAPQCLGQGKPFEFQANPAVQRTMRDDKQIALSSECVQDILNAHAVRLHKKLLDWLNRQRPVPVMVEFSEMEPMAEPTAVLQSEGAR